jgi:DNA-binding NtrC family response regulator
MEANKTINQKGIALVDDHPEIGELLKLRLNAAGIDQVRVFSSAAESLDDIIRNGPYLLTITDFEMPGMNGQQLLEAISALYPQSRVIIITGNTDAAKSLPPACKVLIKGETDFFTRLVNEIRQAQREQEQKGSAG